MATTSKKPASKKTKTAKSSKSIKSTKSTSATKQSVSKKPVVTSIKKADSKVSSTSNIASLLDMQKLRRFNIFMALLHAGQAVSILLMAKANLGIYPITTNYLTTDNLASTQDKIVMVSASRHLLDVHIAWLVVAFFALAATAHLSVASWYRKRYERNLQMDINRARWTEYSLSTGIMLLAVAYLAGVSDLSTLIAIFGLSAVMNLGMLAMETRNQKAGTPSWATYKISALAGLLPWIILGIYAFGAHQYGSTGLSRQVYWVLGSMFVLGGLNALNMYRQYKAKGRWADYIYVERVYSLLSLAAKSALAWQIYSIALRIK
jgi:hypothetical protein